jgi:hypothetical protein
MPHVLALILCVFKPVAQVCTSKMAEDGLVLTLPLPPACPVCVINLSLPFTVSRYLVGRASGWTRHGSAGVWPGVVQNSGFSLRG